MLPSTSDPLAERFAWATEQRLRLIGTLGTEPLQRLYGLYKQATAGDNPSPRPPEHHRVSLLKWQAWDAVRGTTTHDAMAAYVAIVDEADARLAAREAQRPARLLALRPRARAVAVDAAYDVPGHPHPELGEWRNHGAELYIQEFGIERYRANCADMLRRPPASHEERERLERRVRELYRYFFNQADFPLPLGSYVVGEGTLTIADDAPALGPDLAPGRTLPLRIKHKNVTRGNAEFERFQDDTSVTLCRGSLEISLGDGRVFDLPMLTSRIFYPNLPSFMRFTLARDTIYEVYREGHPIWYILAIEGQRQKPSSYASVVYHAPIPRFFRDADGRDRLVRFRLVPVGLEREEGLLDPETQARMLREPSIKDPDPAPGERHYLAKEYRERLARGPVEYDLWVLISPPLDAIEDAGRLANPAFVWDEAICPARPLGRVRIEAPVEHVQGGAQLRFNPAAMPEGFYQPEPTDLHDPVATSWIRRKMYPCSQASTRPGAPRADGGGALAPHLLVLAFDALPEVPVALSVRILGEDGISGTVQIDDVLGASVIDETDAFVKIEVQPVGRPLCLELEASRALALRRIEVVFAAGTEAFLSAAPLAEGSCCWFSGRGSLPRDRPEAVARRVAAELASRRARAPWSSSSDGLPRFTHHASLDDIPAWDQYPVRNQVFANTKLLEACRRSDAPERRFTRFSEVVELVEERHPGLRVPEDVLEDWRSDRMFTEQFVAGFHADHLRRCGGLPTRIPEAELERVRGGRAELERRVALGRVFVADYTLLEGICDGLPAPIVLFEQRGDRSTLTPIGIQLDGDGPLFTPDDAPTDWLAAKMWARLADTNLGGVAAHLVCSHQVVAAFHTSVQRNLPVAHPLHGLLAPHLRNVSAAAWVGHDVLLAEGGIFDKITAMGQHARQIGRRALETWSLRARLDVPHGLRQRGVDAPEALPHYPWRDDGLLVWHALRRLVERVIELLYPDDEAVRGDGELQAFVREAVTVGLVGCDLDPSVEDRDAATTLITGIVFASSAGHAALNSQLYGQLAFAPSSPWRLDGAWPRARGVDPGAPIRWIPDQLTLERTIDMMAILGEREVPGLFVGDEANLGEEPLRSSHPEIRLAWARFRDELQHIGEQITARNERRRIPYEAFLPAKLTASASW